MQTQRLAYQDSHGTLLEGYFVHASLQSTPAPLVLVFHDWSGRNDFAEDKAEKLAALGYSAFAVDMFGKDKLGKNKEEKQALIQPLMENRLLLRDRARAAFDFMHTIPQVNPHKIAAIGFCFGGLCALDLARSGANLCGVVSFHGLLNPPPLLEAKTLKAKILAFHGYDDPMVPPTLVETFAKEMTSAKVDWQIHMYGNTMHGFTNPLANDPSFGTVYDAIAEKRSWLSMQNFLLEVFI